MLDFKELSKDGQDLELLVREILFRQGFVVNWSGKGADGGRDLTCVEARDSFILPDTKRWLVQCKHNAHGGGSVGIGDLDNIVDSCEQHNCTAYLLVCSTQPSSAVINRLESMKKVSSTYWDAVKIEHVLSTPKNWALAQRFFPVSANAENWQVYATERPNHWVVNLRGYYFHLQNRIGSRHDYHLESLKCMLDEIESLALPKDHFIRVRSVYYDDKNGGYTWYMDYMYPSGSYQAVPAEAIGDLLGDGKVGDDGQMYFFDVRATGYSKSSDHYDPDHYDYYLDSERWTSVGSPRPKDVEDIEFAIRYREEVREQEMSARGDQFGRLKAALDKVPFLAVARAVNAHIEDIDKFYARKNWQEITSKYELDDDHFFSVWFFLRVSDDKHFHELMSKFPQAFETHFRLCKLFAYVPTDDGGGAELSADEKDDDQYYDLTLSLAPHVVSDALTGRMMLNEYMSRIADAVEAYVAITASP
jgi:hypothetical protein